MYYVFCSAHFPTTKVLAFFKASWFLRFISFISGVQKVNKWHIGDSCMYSQSLLLFNHLSEDGLHGLFHSPYGHKKPEMQGTKILERKVAYVVRLRC